MTQPSTKVRGGERRDRRMPASWPAHVGGRTAVPFARRNAAKPAASCGWLSGSNSRCTDRLWSRGKASHWAASATADEDGVRLTVVLDRDDLNLVKADEALAVTAPEGASGPVAVHDDLARELAFYNQALAAAQVACRKLEERGAKMAQIFRPDDYFAEMPWLALPYAERKLKATLRKY